jgi:imidazolonepropionase-like amidohydrolase
MAYHLRGTLLPDDVVRDVYVDDRGRITFEPVEGAETVSTDGVVVPGLVDVHAHLSLHSPAGDDAPPAERVRASALAHLDAGVLAVREPGSPDHAAVGLGPTVGLPRVQTAGRFLAPPGMYFPGLAREVDRDALPDAALEELRHSGHWVKVIGDSPIDGLAPTYDAEALAETARRVHEAGGRIAIHCAMPEVISWAIDAGFDSLEHASLMPAELVAAAAVAGVVWVPTRSINAAIREMMGSDGSAVADLVCAGLDAQPDVLCAAVEAGVPILAGTDAGLRPHGQIRHEIELLVAAGLDPSTALGAGSWIARRWLGLPGIKEGAPADLVMFRDDPRDSLGALAAPAIVILDGVLVRGERRR